MKLLSLIDGTGHCGACADMHSGVTNQIGQSLGYHGYQKLFMVC